MILEIPPPHRLEPLHRIPDSFVPPLLQLRLNILQLGCQPLADRLPVNREIPLRLLVPQIGVKPRKLKVSGFPSPRFFLRSVAYRPNSIRRVFSGCSSSPNCPTRSRTWSRNRLASSSC